MSPGQTTDLGDIAVTAGKTVHGRVVTASGAPVAGAAVVVQPDADLETELSLSKQNAGSRGARSDASGRFEITGLPDEVSEVRIQAQHPDVGQALPRALTLADLAGGVALVLAGTGAVSGRVLGDAPGQYHRIEARSRGDGQLYLTSAMDGAFWFAQLPAGDYTASLGGDDGRPATTGGQRRRSTSRPTGRRRSRCPSLARARRYEPWLACAQRPRASRR